MKYMLIMIFTMFLVHSTCTSIVKCNNKIGLYTRGDIEYPNYSGSFSSNEIPGLPGLAGSKNNIDAAAGVVPGICLFKGGSKKLKRKIVFTNLLQIG